MSEPADFRGSSTCSTCCFWRPESHNDTGTGWGQCRRMPPALPAEREDKLVVVGVWPHTEDRDWCGEWQSVASPVRTAGD
jgi:hypothetical protein